jgi:MFS family permease
MQPPADTPRGLDGLNRTFRALRYRNYRLFFIGQGLSLVGTWMQQMAMAWLVYDLTKSPKFLGLVGFMGQIPALFLGWFAGVLADRWDRHRILIVTQTLAMTQAFVLSALVLTGMIRPWHILLLALFVGCVNAIDMTARQSFVIDMVERKEDLGNAIALNSSMFNGARLVGPAVAGALVPLVGEGICFLVNGISYLAVIVSLVIMRFPPAAVPAAGPDTGLGPPAPSPRGGVHAVFAELGEGIRYAYGTRPIRYVLTLLGALSLFAMPFGVIMPVMAKDVLHGGPSTLGMLMAFGGLGALVGALYLAARRDVLGIERWTAFAPALFGTMLVAFSFSRTLWLSLPLILIASFGTMVQIASTNTILQTVVDDDKRGRVMSLYSIVFMGTSPFGALLAGVVAAHIGAPDTLLLCGTCAVIGSLLFTLKLPLLGWSLRRHYVRGRRLLEEGLRTVTPTDTDIAAGGE